MRKFVIVLLFLSLVVAGVLSFFASDKPDGLEKVAEDGGFAARAGNPRVTVFPDYTVPGLEGFLSNGLAGVTGVAVVFGFVYLLGKAMARKR